MEGLYLYGIAGYPPELSNDIQGLGGKNVRLLPWERMAAAVTDCPLTSWPVDEAHLARHQSVLESLMNSRPVLPVRFNTFLKTEEAVFSFLAEREKAFLSALERVQGKLEMGLRVLGGDGATEEVFAAEKTAIRAAGPGTRYLRKRFNDERHRDMGDQLIENLQICFLPLASESRIRRFSTKRILLSGAYLVERGNIEVFRKGVQEAWEKYPHLHFLLTGPWPPYHFVNGGTDETRNLFGL